MSHSMCLLPPWSLEVVENGLENALVLPTLLEFQPLSFANGENTDQSFIVAPRSAVEIVPLEPLPLTWSPPGVEFDATTPSETVVQELITKAPRRKLQLVPENV